MHYSTIAAILLAATAAANPIASPALTEPIESRGLTVTSKGLSPITDGDLQERGIRVTSQGLTPITDQDLEERDADIEKRSTGIHSCGPRSGWMVIENRGDKLGFKEAVTAFCNNADGMKVPHTYKFAVQVDGLTLTNNKPAYLVGQVYNRHMKGGYVINVKDCTDNLYLFTQAGAKCYGKKNKDTKGGQVDVESLGSWEAYPKAA